MALTPGTRLGPYEIVALLGAGGMGEVYRAKDTRLDRAVAIKALPEAYALHSERLARFEREARLLASLSHPNIAGIHGLEQIEGRVYLVLEFVEGETLAARLRRGPLPVREALGVARQVAAAVEAAHESGIIHRDLKPGNVMLRPDGEVKVLDFGLAKGNDGTSASDPGLSASPTMTFAATAAGVILGTAAYMSPEQARGKGVDRRTDIWSFGCVLYECLSARQAFEGETVSDLIARILEREPDWRALPAATPAAVRELLQRCLEKDPKQRLRDIGDARLTLEREIAASSSSGKLAAARGAPAAPRSPLVLAAAVALGLVLGAGGWALLGRGAGGSVAAPAMTHVSITLPKDPRITDGMWSPDGRMFAFIGLPSSASALGARGSRIYVRRPDSFELSPLAGTEGASDLQFTSDSRWIVFRGALAPGASVDRLARVPIDGSVPPVTVTEWDPRWRSFTLLGNGDVLFLDDTGERLTRLPAGGGPARELGVDRGDLRATLRLGRALPGDRAVMVDANVYRERGWSVEVGAIDLQKLKLVMLGQDGGHAKWSPTGHLLFSRGDVLLAAPFDLKSLALRGTPVAVASGLLTPFSYLPGFFDLGPDGSLLVVPGGSVGNERRLGIVEPDGKLRTLDFEPHPYQTWPSPSDDGHTFGVRVTNAQGIDEIWAGDLNRPGLRRVASWPAADCTGLLLSFDGRSAAYARVGRDALDGIYISDLQRSVAAARVVSPESSTVSYRADSWSPDGSWLVVTRTPAGQEPDLWIARLSAGRDSAVSLRPLRATPFLEAASDFSRDGKWLAWQSDESGREEIYVAPFAADGTLGSPVRITDQGASGPEWLADGRHLVIRTLDGRRARIVDIGSPPGSGPRSARDWYDLDELRVADALTSLDGRAMVILRGPQEDQGVPALNLVFGWSRELQRHLAAGR